MSPAKEDITHVQFLRNERAVAATSASKLFLWDVNSGREILHPISIPKYCFKLNGRRVTAFHAVDMAKADSVYIGTEEGLLYVFSLKGKGIKELTRAATLFTKSELKEPASLDVIATGEEPNRLLVAFKNLGIIILNAAKKTAVQRISVQGVRDVVWSARMGLVAAGLESGCLAVVSVKEKGKASRTDVKVCCEAVKKVFLVRNSSDASLLVTLSRNGSSFLLDEVEVYAHTEESEFKSKVPIGFPNGCSALFAGQILALHKETLNFVAGLSNSMKFCVCPLEPLFARAKSCSLFPQPLPFALDWVRPVNTKYIQGSKETSLLINHLYCCHSDNFRTFLKKSIPAPNVLSALALAFNSELQLKQSPAPHFPQLSPSVLRGACNGLH